MSAAPARIIFSLSSVKPLLLAASPAAAAGNNSRQGRHRGDSIRPLVASTSSNMLLPNDFDIQEGLTDVQKILHQRQKNGGREMMVTIDNLKRLCIDHYFKEEIKSAMSACMDLIHSDDLFDATLAFRLLREAGHDVSANDVLPRFTDDNGEFKLPLRQDIRGLLSLHDMSHLNIGGEALLYKATEFSSKHLASAIRSLEPSLAEYVRQSLDHPYHLSLMQYKARHHLTYLQSLPIRDTAVEKLADAEFQLNKLLHQTEIQEIKRWWMDLGLVQEIPVVRDQVQKWYMWSMTALQGCSFSRYRVEITKIISLVYVVDDIFDLVGTLDELSLFTEAVKTWNTAAGDSLPSCMRSCYRALYTITNEIANMAEKEHGLNPINHLRKAWAVLFDAFMVEAKWLATDQVPTAEDYLRNGVLTSGLPLTFAHIFIMLGCDQSTETLIDHLPMVISCPAKILRLWDDMGSAKDEAQEGIDGSYKDFYLMENPRCSSKDAEAHMRSLIAREWEELNRECLCRRTFSSNFTMTCLNITRMISVMYSYNKEHRLIVLEDFARMLIL
nr:terpene synthase 2 [Cymbopogon martinii]